MLIRGETFNKRKAVLLEYIKFQHDFITCLEKLTGNEDLRKQVIKQEKEILHNYLQELIKLKRWQAIRKAGYGKK